MKKRLFTSIFAIIIGLSTFAQQNARTAYFMDSYAYRYKFNPSFIPENGHLGVGVGNVGVAVQTNLDAKTAFVYDESKGAFNIPFLDDYSSVEQYMPENIRLGLGEDIDLFSLGFHKGHSFTSFDVSFKTDVNLNAPSSLLSGLATTDENYKDSYHIPGFEGRGESVLSIAYGKAYQVGGFLSVGGRVKVLVGVASARAKFGETYVNVTDQAVEAKTSGELDVTLPKPFEIPIINGVPDIEDIKEPDDLKIGDLRPAGLGLAADLGAAIQPIRGLTLSAAILDLGFMGWSKGIRSSLSDFSMEIDKDEEYHNLNDVALPFTTSMQSRLTLLSTTLNAGIEYALPFYDGISLGVMGTRRVAGACSWGDTRAILNIRAPKVIELAGSIGRSTFGNTFGAALHLHFGPLSLFTAIDSLAPVLSLDKNLAPHGQLNTNFVVGLNLLFLTKHSVI